MEIHKPLTKTERKILVYKKCQEGKSYEQAYEEVKQELTYLEKMAKEKRANGRWKENSNFKEEFLKMIENDEEI